MDGQSKRPSLKSLIKERKGSFIPFSATSQILGHLSWDAETKSTGSGKTITKFKMYTMDGPKDKAVFSSWEVVVWGEMPSWKTDALVKGATVYVTGRIQIEEFESKGEKRTKVVLTADAFNGVNVVAPPKDKGDGVVSKPRSAAGNSMNKTMEITDEDVPF